MCTRDHLLKILCGTQGVRLVLNTFVIDPKLTLLLPFKDHCLTIADVKVLMSIFRSSGLDRITNLFKL